MENEWLTCYDVDAMLHYLRYETKVRRSPNGRRKLRLFACGCCRQVWHLIEDPRSQRMVHLSEQLADGLVETSALAEAELEAEAAKSEADKTSAGLSSLDPARKVGAAIGAAFQTAAKKLYEAARKTAFSALCSVGGGWSIHVSNPAWEAQASRQANLLRCLFGNPFRSAPPLAPAVLQWNDRIVKRLAEEAYEHRLMPAGTLDPERLAVLADALEEAGCTAPEILDHLRDAGPHWRGCHIVDLLLGKS